MIIDICDLLREIQQIPRRRQTLVVGIDGCGGSGKSSLARKFKEFGTNVTVVQMDDFYLPSLDRANVESGAIGGSFDWPRIRRQVLDPLSMDAPGRYQRYDWDRDQLAEWYDVPTGGLVVVEGVYSTRTELADLYDFRIWVESPKSLRLARGVTRDGEDARHLWEQEWMPAEDRYVETHRPRLTAHLTIDGTGERADLGANRVAVMRAPGNWNHGQAGS